MRLRISLILFFLFSGLKIYAQDISTAWEYFLKEKYNIADRILNSLLKEGVNSPEVYYLKGLILSRRGDFSQARSYFEKLNFYGVRWSQFSLILRADTFLQEGKLKEAKTLYQTFLTRYPESEYIPEVLYKYAHILRKEGSWEEARTYLRKVGNKYP
jgi:TolA-binding protein